ncbi:e1-E2 ATPase, partial [Ostertagia ostertagi]
GHCKTDCRLKQCTDAFSSDLTTKADLGVWSRWRRRDKVSPEKRDISEARKAVGISFVEHHLTIEQLKDLYPDSYIHHEFPERSDGLHSEEASFTKLLPSKAIVIRDCEEKEINTEDIVVGDLVIIRSGSRIPADIRILQTNCLTIEVSEVTGRKTPVECTAEAAASYVSVFDSRNVAFKGSYCTEGDGLGIVIRTGKFTVKGHCKTDCRLKQCTDLTTKADLGVWSRWRRRDKVSPEKRDISEARKAVGISFVEHHLTIEQLKDLYPDSYIHHEFPERSDGLHSEEARKRLRDGGGNVLPPPREEHLFRVFIRQFHFKFWLLLTGAAFLSIAAYFAHYAQGFNEPLNLYCAFILLLVVLVMSLLSLWQESKARKAIVIRDCEEKEINTEDIVVGDLVIIRSGSRIPADIRILQTNCLTIEVSEVTGRKTPVECTAEAAASYVSVFDSRNVAFKGSYCTEGDGLGIVIRTGKFTVLGGIANLHTQIPPTKSKLQAELRTFAQFISVLAICMAVAMFLIGCIVAKFENVLDHFVMGFLVVIVANIPQGLPATVMSQLRIIARRMAQKNIYIKKLDLIDELGAATVICADKSGTLTMNQMVVTDLWFNRRMVTGAGVDLKHPHIRAMRSTVRSSDRLEEPLPEILTVMSVCNRAQFEHVRRSMRRVSTMRALQKSASEAMLSGPVKKKFTIVDTRTGQVSEHRRPTVPDADGLPALENGVRSEEPVPVSTHPTTGRTKSRKNDIFGIPSDVALVKYVELNASVEAIRQRYHSVHEIPFNSIRRWQLIVSRCLADVQPVENLPEPAQNEARYVVMMKGAPEVILGKCKKARVNKDVVDIDDNFRQECQ